MRALLTSDLIRLQPMFRALYRAFTQCCFIEDEGDVVFYKNQFGKQQRMLSEKAAQELGLSRTGV